MQQAAILIVVAATLAASMLFWVVIVSRLRRGAPIIELEPRRPAPWTVVDLAIVVVAHLFFTMAGQLLLREIWKIDLSFDVRELAPKDFMAFQLQSIAVMVATVVVGFVMIRIGRHSTLADLGLVTGRLRYDAALGAAAFVALAPPVYALQAALVYFFPTQHPLIDIVQQHPDRSIFLVVALAAAIIAPLTEEFFFRVLLQGWLESLTSSASPTVFPHGSGAAASPEPTTAASLSANAASDAGLPGKVVPSGDSSNDRIARVIPIVASAFVFSLLHLGQGPAPVPLFFLALGLGYLYQRTHRLWPAVVLHFLLNTSSLIMLWMQVV
jgi:membrane protease YdiL (CAAX protease family)